ncbi:MAG: hypothetical protein LBV74_09095 [Tannerella sp.]|jgi:hypothetical protein|nr:hypothetical protein [Tannerella sp.]
MVSALKYFIVFLFISLIPSESGYVSEGSSVSCREQNVINDGECGIFSCISDKMEALVAYVASEAREQISKYEENKSCLLRENDEFPTPLFIDIVVRTTDWFSHTKMAQNKLPDFKDQKESSWCNTLSYQCKSNDIYIPPLKYYIYTLKKNHYLNICFIVS